ncbi:hypothetical protein DRE_06043 [Drechslerella stenobrocha 248]|uniref:Heterokaryon incompatibility domain-containing protein n=1 Tax=Drechslerella stenobrocha 248 TaxID=1043628 RepID=W7I828_9PEZI|nr:hypothetical protein DRE_06043 [Drechslerella stenobrocha 248]
MAESQTFPEEQYTFQRLPRDKDFRIFELAPGEEGSPISCQLHIVQWDHPREYEAISYAWGDASLKDPIIVDGKRLDITRSLHMAIGHLRYKDRPRFLWADVICIDQSHNHEKGKQIGQMKKIYENSQTVLSWLGPDTEDHKAAVAMDYIRTVSKFLCKELNLTPAGLKLIDNITELVFKHRTTLPVPDQCEFSSEEMWKTLAWFYSFPYFSRVWVIQEVNANRERIAHCGGETIDWDLVEVVAGFIIMETDFSKRWDFGSTYVWWAATTTELKRPENWLFMLYLASNYGTSEPKDVIYGLRGLMKFSKGAELLEPDYNKTTLEVYRDSVEAALTNFENTDVLLYLSGKEEPSWVPSWNVSMLFRNPFRFGNPVPWKPAGDTKAVWSINKSTNVISLDGFVAGTIKTAQPYNESYFGNTTLSSDEGKATLKQVWGDMLATIQEGLFPASYLGRALRWLGISTPPPLTREALNATANSFSFGLNEKSIPADESYLLYNFIAYLKIVLDEETYRKYIPQDLSDEAESADGLQFGKPVWDFTYPESSLFVTDGGLLGCCVSPARPGDVIFVPTGSTYPLIIRPDEGQYRIRGFTYTYGIMRGEKKDTPTQVFQIR